MISCLNSTNVAFRSINILQKKPPDKKHLIQTTFLTLHIIHRYDHVNQSLSVALWPWHEKFDPTDLHLWIYYIYQCYSICCCVLKNSIP